MKTEQHQSTLSISDIPELGAATSNSFRDEVRAALKQRWDTIEIDLSKTTFLDSCGLGALISVHKTACNSNGDVTIRLLNPTPPVQQLFELTRMHRLFEIVKR